MDVSLQYGVRIMHKRIPLNSEGFSYQCFNRAQTVNMYTIRVLSKDLHQNAS